MPISWQEVWSPGSSRRPAGRSWPTMVCVTQWQLPRRVSSVSFSETIASALCLSTRVSCTYLLVTNQGCPLEEHAWGTACTVGMKTLLLCLWLSLPSLPELGAWSRRWEQVPKKQARQTRTADRFVAAMEVATRHVGFSQTGVDPTISAKGAPPRRNHRGPYYLGGRGSCQDTSPGSIAEAKAKVRRPSPAAPPGAKPPCLFSQRLWLFCLLSPFNLWAMQSNTQSLLGIRAGSQG